jgi:hypothetical protein
LEGSADDDRDDDDAAHNELGGEEEEDVHFDVSFFQEEEEDAAELEPAWSTLPTLIAGQCCPLRSPDELVRFCEALPRDDPNGGPAV